MDLVPAILVYILCISVFVFCVTALCVCIFNRIEIKPSELPKDLSMEAFKTATRPKPKLKEMP